MAVGRNTFQTTNIFLRRLRIMERMVKRENKERGGVFLGATALRNSKRKGLNRKTMKAMSGKEVPSSKEELTLLGARLQCSKVRRSHVCC